MSPEVQHLMKKIRLARDGVIDDEKSQVSSSVASIVNSLHYKLRALSDERDNDKYEIEISPDPNLIQNFLRKAI